MSKWVLTAFLLLSLSRGVPAEPRIEADTKDTLSHLKSIADLLDEPDHHPVHILYVHGINAMGAGDSSQLRDSICTELKLCDKTDWKNDGVEYADKGEFSPSVMPPTLAYLGTPIWASEEEWQAAAPFVVHWEVTLRHHPAPLVVDELNWWPLVMAIKCRHVVANEARVAGASKQLLEVCSEPGMQNPDGLGRFYPWITAERAKELAAIRPRAVLVNRELKDGLVDWGLADVLLATGPMGGLIRDGLRQLMAKSAAFDPTGTLKGASAQERYDWRGQLHGRDTMDQEFVGVTHSLGAYLFFNALSIDVAKPGQTAADANRVQAESDAVHYIFERTSQVYFFANQLQMLEVTNLETEPDSSASAPKSRGLAPPPTFTTTPAANLRSLVERWKDSQGDFQTRMWPGDESRREKLQVIAWSDPSDVITWRVPRIGSVDVVNLLVQNAPRWFGLLESPTGAHDNYSKNIHVLRVMFLNTKSGQTP